MQEDGRRSNQDRTLRTRAALIAAARRLFVAKGYADTGTPELVAEAGVTRGALYHHFVDKQALFGGVVEAENAEAAARLFLDHPHITVFPGDGVDIMPFVT